MKLLTLKLCLTAAIVLALATILAAQSNSASPDSATFDPDGTAHITRVIPMPATISPEAQKWLGSLNQQKAQPMEPLPERRIHTDAWRKRDTAEARKLYSVNVEETTTAGVRTDIITPVVSPGKILWGKDIGSLPLFEQEAAAGNPGLGDCCSGHFLDLET